VFLVSHDRRFLDNVVTSTIAWEGDPAFGGRPGLWREYEGGYEDWLLQRERSRVAAGAAAAAAVPAAAAPAAPAPAVRTKLSYKEQRELDALPARIESLEAEQKTIAGQLPMGRCLPGPAARCGVARALCTHRGCRPRWNAGRRSRRGGARPAP
jgi:ATP-binding cassette subfamily F protein uup